MLQQEAILQAELELIELKLVELQHLQTLEHTIQTERKLPQREGAQLQLRIIILDNNKTAIIQETITILLQEHTALHLTVEAAEDHTAAEAAVVALDHLEVEVEDKNASFTT